MSTHPATTTTHGPIRKVVDTKPYMDYRGVPAGVREVLECGHHGKLVTGPWGKVGKSRRCWDCLTPEQKREAGRVLGW